MSKRILKLTQAQRTELLENQKANKILELFDGFRDVPEIARTVEMPVDGLVNFIYERPELKDALINYAISLYLAIDKGYTRTQIRERLGLTHYRFQELTKSHEFEEAYARHFNELAQSPVSKSAQHSLVEDLVPKAFRVFNEILDDEEAPTSQRLRAAIEIFARANVTAEIRKASERHELAQFLADRGGTINIIQMNTIVPESYQVAVKDLPNVEILDAMVIEEQDEIQ